MVSRSNTEKNIPNLSIAMHYYVHWYYDPSNKRIVSVDLSRAKDWQAPNSTFNVYNQTFETTMGKSDLFIGGKTTAKNVYVSLLQNENSFQVERTSMHPFESTTPAQVYKLSLVSASA